MGGADTSPTSLLVHFVDLHCCPNNRTGTQRVSRAERDWPGLATSSNYSLFECRTVSFLKLTSLEPAALSLHHLVRGCHTTMWKNPTCCSVHRKNSLER
jgi:hypothetical protein